MEGGSVLGRSNGPVTLSKTNLGQQAPFQIKIDGLDFVVGLHQLARVCGCGRLARASVPTTLTDNAKARQRNASLNRTATTKRARTRTYHRRETSSIFSLFWKGNHSASSYAHVYGRHRELEEHDRGLRVAGATKQTKGTRRCRSQASSNTFF